MMFEIDLMPLQVVISPLEVLWLDQLIMIVQCYYGLVQKWNKPFMPPCKARGVVPSEHARQLITDYVLNHWGIDKPKSPDIIAVERCDTTLDMFPADDQPPAETRPPVRPPVRPNRPKKKKRR